LNSVSDANTPIEGGVPTEEDSEVHGASSGADEYFSALNRITPWATYLLLVINLAAFSLEALWGGTTSSTTLWRMGAESRDPVLAGEFWRLITAAFLHVGPMHLAMNMWALWVLGPFLERVLGITRFLSLYLVAALGGSLCSMLFGGHHLSAGASGALWGLMAAQFALAFRAGDALPAEACARVRSRGWQPLLINLIYSFTPGISMSAHLGGGVTGGLMMMSGLLTSRLNESSAELELPMPDDHPLADSAKRPGMLTGLVLLALPVAALGVAAWHDQPWELLHAPPHHRVILPGDLLSIEIPTSLTHVRKASTMANGVSDVVYGDLPRDPFVVEVQTKLLDRELSGEETAATLEAIRIEFTKAQPPKGYTADGTTQIVKQGAVSSVHSSYRAANGAKYGQWITLSGRCWMRLIVATSAEVPNAWMTEPDRIIGTLQASAKQ